jgi:hypothetical protein
MVRRFNRYTALALSAPLVAACSALISIPDAQLISDAQLRPDSGMQPGVDGSPGVDGGPGEDSSVPMCDLTRPENCGGCNNDCTNGTCSNAGVCTLSSVDFTTLRGLHVAGGVVYVAERGYGAISTCAANGCDAPTRLPTYDKDGIEPRAITGDNAFLYWSNVYSGVPGPAIVRTPFDGGASSVITEPGFQPCGEVAALALGPSGLIVAHNTKGPFYVTNPAGTTLVPQLVTTSPVGDSNAITLHGNGMYWRDSNAILHCGSIPCAADPTRVRTITGKTAYLASTTNDLYFIEEGERKVWRCPHSAPTNCKVVWPDAPETRALVAKDGFLYLGTSDLGADGGLLNSGTIVRCSDQDCQNTQTTIAKFPGVLYGMTVEGPSVYWTVSETEQGTNYLVPSNIMKAHK